MNNDTIHPMDDAVNPPRRYESPLRAGRALETRTKIMEAARMLFLRDGYVSTSIVNIAREAGVSPQTIYGVFGNKRELLSSLMDVSIGGDARPLGVLEREEPQRMREERDQHEQLRMMARGIREIMDRAGPMFDVMRIAAATDTEIATAYAGLQAVRRQNMGRVIGWILANGPLKPGLSGEEAADILWSLTSADVHRMLRRECAWPPERYERWLGETLIAALLP